MSRNATTAGAVRTGKQRGVMSISAASSSAGTLSKSTDAVELGRRHDCSASKLPSNDGGCGGGSASAMAQNGQGVGYVWERTSGVEDITCSDGREKRLEGP